MRLPNRVRRAQPLLGTIVEVSIQSELPETVLQEAVSKAFASISQIQKLMSVHEAASDISILNRQVSGEPIKVNPLTYSVLESAEKFSKLSDGVFNVCVGSILTSWGFLPGEDSDNTQPRKHKNGIVLLPDCVVQVSGQLKIDLGGIAKGFAVDVAVELLEATGIECGIVNAGGDMRAFGSFNETVVIRNPDDSSTYIELMNLQRDALATSSPTLSTKTVLGKIVSPLVDGRTFEPIVKPISVSVLARSCMVADALTKIAINDFEDFPAVLRLFEARAFLYEGGNLFTVGLKNGSNRTPT